MMIAMTGSGVGATRRSPLYLRRNSFIPGRPPLLMTLIVLVITACGGSEDAEKGSASENRSARGESGGDDAGGSDDGSDDGGGAEVPPGAPVVERPLADLDYDAGFRTATVDVNGVFRDPDGDPITLTTSVQDTGVVTTTVNGLLVTVTEVGRGQTAITINAEDPGGNTASDTFELTVNNRAPMVVTVLDDQVFGQGFTSAMRDLSSIFVDPDGDSLTFAASAATGSVVDVTTSASTLTLNEVGPGTDEVTVIANDQYGGSASSTFEVRVNRGPNNEPVVETPIADQSFGEGFTSATFDLSGTFSDPDGDPLTITARTSTATVVNAGVGGATLTLNEAGVGIDDVILTADDQRGGVIETTFRVTVNDPPIIATPLDDREYSLGFGSSIVQLTDTFSDPNGDELTLSARTDTDAVVNVEVAGTTLTLTELAAGTDVVTVVAEDENGARVEATFSVSVTCNPESCTSLGADCGAPDDGCGGTLSCGDCSGLDTCGGGGVDFQCGCTAAVMGVCGRRGDGIVCSVYDTSTDSFGPIQGPQSSFSDANGWNDFVAAKTIRFPDVNGDGLADVCARSAGGIVCATGNGDGTFNSRSLWLAQFRNDQGWNDSPSLWATIGFPDVNGDGAADVCGRSGNGIHCATSNGSDGFANYRVWSSQFSGANFDDVVGSWGSLEFVDLDGDGRSDVCARRNSGAPTTVVCAYSTGSDFNAALAVIGINGLNAYRDEPNGWGTLSFPDLNASGRRDMCAWGGYDLVGLDDIGVDCHGQDAPRNFSGGFSFSNAFTVEQGFGFPQYWGTLRFADLNGDGRADLCIRVGGGIRCQLNNGPPGFAGGFNLWVDQFRDNQGWGNSPEFWATIEFPDINGDGWDDVCGRGGAGVRCFLSNGADGFDSAAIVTPGFDNPTWGTADTWGTLQYVPLERGTCRRAGHRHPWGSSGVSPRY